jgi:hypothetical protein
MDFPCVFCGLRVKIPTRRNRDFFRGEQGINRTEQGFSPQRSKARICATRHGQIHQPKGGSRSIKRKCPVEKDRSGGIR